MKTTSKTKLNSTEKLMKTRAYAWHEGYMHGRVESGDELPILPREVREALMRAKKPYNYCLPGRPYSMSDLHLAITCRHKMEYRADYLHGDIPF